MLRAYYKKHRFRFITPGGTSRGVLTHKDSWYLFVCDSQNAEVVGVGECSVLPGLSIDYVPGYESKIQEVCENINEYAQNLHVALIDFPSVRFGLEMALLDLENGGKRMVYSSGFYSGKASIPINGLIWMGEVAYMKSQLKQKLDDGFNCIKIKVGAIDFEKEIELIRGIRQLFSPAEIEIRVDANGAFTKNDAESKLKRLSELGIHSIEQPVKAGQWELMADLCSKGILPIALDEELIGINGVSQKQRLIDTIKPDYIILKPSLLGGFKASEEWVHIAECAGIKWWATSALEGNIGLNAIAQWTSLQNNSMPQGLGTGQVFSNNINSPLKVNGGRLCYDQNESWGDLP